MKQHITKTDISRLIRAHPELPSERKAFISFFKKKIAETTDLESIYNEYPELRWVENWRLEYLLNSDCHNILNPSKSYQTTSLHTALLSNTSAETHDHLNLSERGPYIVLFWPDGEIYPKDILAYAFDYESAKKVVQLHAAHENMGNYHIYKLTKVSLHIGPNLPLQTDI